MKLFVILALLVSCELAQATLLFQRALSPLQKTVANAFSRRETKVTLDWKALSAGATSPDQIAKELELNLFEDAFFVAKLTRVQWISPHSFDWVGKIGEDDVVFAVRNGYIHGTVQYQDRFFEIESIDKLNQKITEINQDAFLQLEQTNQNDVEGTAEPFIDSTAQNDTPLNDSAGPIIDVMVVYLKEASSKITNMDTFLASLFTLSNQAYLNSGINQTIRLVHHEEVVSGIVGRENLDWLRKDAGIAAMRDRYGADLVAMILEKHDAAGTANGNFCIVTRSAAFGNKTFPHELGHTMGAQHAWEQFTTHKGYSYGYINHPKSWRTIMSYSECKSGGSCTRINWFSNPDVKYNGNPTGRKDSCDNARTLRMRSVTVSNYRASKLTVDIAQQGISYVPNGPNFELVSYSHGRLLLKMKKAEKLQVSIIKLNGKISQIANANFSTGEHWMTWSSSLASHGIYVLEVKNQNGNAIRKRIFAK